VVDRKHDGNMAATKAALKSIKAHIDKSEFQQALDEAKDLLAKEPENYTAYLFLGVAYEKQGDLPQAEKSLLSASKIKPHDIQALKGIINLYEKQGQSKLDLYHNVTTQLATIYASQDDREQCQNVVDRYEAFAKKHGSPAQYRHALELILPTSPLYQTLEGRVLKPSLAYQRILESAQKEEKDWVQTQIAERRTRLGARLDRVTAEVKREAIPRYQIEEKYDTLIQWTQDDVVRYDLEQEMFQRVYDNLMVVPTTDKPYYRDRLLNIANGMVVIKQQFLLAWKIALEWVDAEDLQDWDPTIIRQYVEFFPDDGLSKVFRGYLDSDACPYPKEEPGHDSDAPPPVRLTEAEQLIMMNEGLEECKDSPLAHRIVAHTYRVLEEWPDTVQLAEKAQSLYLAAQKQYALELQNSIDATDITLASALIYHQSPRHHQRSKKLFDDILSRKPTQSAALLGVGLIYEDDDDFPQAVKFLSQAYEREPHNLQLRAELAWCQARVGDISTGLQDLQEILGVLMSGSSPNKTMQAEILYRIAHCKWQMDPSAKARKSHDGAYKELVASVTANPSYAPAWTLLGIFFQDYAKQTSKVKANARKALRTAFELSASELEAAERLANDYATVGEWDMVELIAQRVVKSDAAKVWPGSKKKAPSWPYAAMGVVNINKQQYSQSIVSFQSALRTNTADYHSWVGLGESYLHSGRYVSAARAFSKAESINHGLPVEQTWFAKYMLANVQKEMGVFEDAIASYESTLKLKEDDLGMLIALLQSYADCSWAKINQSMYGEAGRLATHAVDVANRIVKQRTDVFNLWKSVADACSASARVRAFCDKEGLLKVTQLLKHKTTEGELDVFSEYDGFSIKNLEDDLNSTTKHTTEDVADCYLAAAVLASKRSIHASANDIHAQAIAWYNLGWAEHQAYVTAGPSMLAKGHKPKRLLTAAMRCFKRAIELEASNADFWNALGVVTMVLSPKVSQHSFVRSLNLNEHSARAWTNLGVLYLSHNDSELANNAFTRAQSADPEYAPAWLGQGLVATLVGRKPEARGLFTHAFEISGGSTIASRRLFSTSVFDEIFASSKQSQGLVSLLGPLLAIRQLHALSPANITVGHLLALYAERAGDFETAIESLKQICDHLEEAYEKSESEEHLSMFAQAKADLSRCELGQHDYRSAAETAETVLDLISDETSPAYAQAHEKSRLSARLTAGLAHSHLKDVDSAIKHFQAALETSPGEPDVVCMLAQVLWAKGGNAERDAARSQLFNVVDEHPSHVQAICLLAVTGLADGDKDVLEAASESLESLQTDNSVSAADKLRVSRILAAIRFDQGAFAKRTEAQKSIFLSPEKPQGWLELYDAVGDEQLAISARKNVERQVPPHGEMSAFDAAQALLRTDGAGDATLAKMLAPWDVSIGI
jgi:superkiller protein 3